MKVFNDLKQRMLKNEITKVDFIRERYELGHSMLYEYPALLDPNWISGIQITQDGVWFESKNHGISLIGIPGDHRCAPLEILNFGKLEEKELETTLVTIQGMSPGKAFIDVGANLGWYSLLVGKKFQIPVLAVEPHPVTFGYLSKNVEKNALTNVKAVQLGLSENEGEGELYFYPSGSVNVSLKNVSGRSDAESVKTPLTTLDSLVKQEGLSPGFIKIDVEGAEFLVLKGGATTLMQDRPVLFVELLRKWSEPFGYHPNEVIDFLKGLSYRCFIQSNEGLIPFQRMTETTLETNFFFFPHENQPA